VVSEISLLNDKFDVFLLPYAMPSHPITHITQHFFPFG